MGQGSEQRKELVSAEPLYKGEEAEKHEERQEKDNSASVGASTPSLGAAQ